MNRSPLDTLIYQWALSDEDKAVPTVLEDISNLSDEEKVTSLLEVFAHLVSSVVEQELSYITLVEGYIQKASMDEALGEAELEEVAEAIETLEDVQALREESNTAAKMLDVFGRAFVKAVTA